MTKHESARFFELPRAEAIDLLARHNVGRLAYSFHDRVDIEPISYVYDDDWIYVRTSPGTKLTTLRHHPWVAFEVDEAKHRLDWRSVVVRGAIYLVDPERSEKDRLDYDNALERLRTIDADAFAESDATPHRRAVLRIHVDEITGRGAASSAAGGS